MSGESCARLQARGGWAEDALEQRCGWPIAPRNTWSNLAYPLAGAYLVSVDPSRSAWVLAVALAVLGVGSALYHGLKTRWANKLDWVGMYLVFGSLGIHGIDPANPGTPAAMIVTAVLVAGLFSYVVPNVSLEVQMGVLLWFSAVPGVLAGHSAQVALGMGAFVVAFGAWHADRRRFVVGKWGHALWHILTAFAIPTIFLAQGR